MTSKSMDIDFKEYQLSCQLKGHEDDARGICICGNAGIATSSRDRTVRFWILDGSQKRDYSMSKILLGHTSVVGPLAWIPPNEEFPEGGVISGGMDSLILVWNLATGEKSQMLKGHKLQVTGIALDGLDVVSSSVDCTLRRWSGGQQVEEWEAHKCAIQAVIKLPSGELVTGSSDMTMKLWKGKSCVHTFQGHTDTVRGVAIMPNVGILSASHDGTIRLWALSGELLMEMAGHSSIVYSVDAHASGLIASGSEDCSAKIWKEGVCVQSIEHPGCVWDAKFLESGDIVTACSDGIVRIWTIDHEKTAEAVELDSFASQISQYKLSRKKVGGLKLEDLPGLDALETPGSSDGQTKVVREGDNGVAYAWNIRDQKWDKIGEVVDGPDDNVRPSMLNGVQYDHVFDVDIGYGGPIRKLPYNRSENPYDVADKWLVNENLPLSYRQQIVEFILQNTGQKDFTPDPLFRDPYTGSNAYVPGAPSKSSELLRRMELQPNNMVRTPRRGVGSRGESIQLLVNHFRAIAVGDALFYHYSVSIKYEDGSPVDAKGIGRRILDQVCETYTDKIEGKKFAYDGEKALFTVGPLPQNNLEFTVVLEDLSSNRKLGSPGDDGAIDRKRQRRQPRSKTYIVAISYATRIPIQAIANALGQGSDHFQEAVRVLNIILRQSATQQGCLVVRQSFFHNNGGNFDLGGGVFSYRGLHSSFRATQEGLSLNMDVSTTLIVRPGPVIEFLLFNQNVDNPIHIDWIKAKKTLKNLRVKETNSNREYKIIGLSDMKCNDQKFSFKQRNGEGSEAQEVEITVYDYFVNHRHIPLFISGDMPCLNVGKPNRPIYIPLEVCSLVPLQRYTKALTILQRAKHVEESREKPSQRIDSIKDGLTKSNYAADPLLESSGVAISTEFTRVQGRVLAAPMLVVGNDQKFVPQNGRWNFNEKKLVDPVKINLWFIVNFSAHCNSQTLCDDLIRCGNKIGLTISIPREIIEEKPESKESSADVRVEQMIQRMKRDTLGAPKFILCVLPEKNSDLYGTWKRRLLCNLDIVTQCIAPGPGRVNDQYLTNLLLKINVKLGGLNSVLLCERHPLKLLPLFQRKHTLILGMDVSHGSPGRDVPSVAAVVGSRQWPFISKYSAVVRSQSPRAEMITSLFEPVSVNGITQDKGIVRDLLMDFHRTSRQKPDQIIIFRDGVSESQFNQVLNIELDQIIRACKFLDETWNPRFLVVVAQKRHHTRIFQNNAPDINVPPGTVLDNGICHPKNNDFYLCAHTGNIGTTRPTHYHVLYDELGDSPDDFQEFVHSLSYVCQRSTNAISVVAPIYYAHLAAAQVSQFVKFDKFSESPATANMPKIPKMFPKVRRSMFFC